MNNFEINKYAGALLAAALAVVAISEISNFANSPSYPEKVAYAIDTGEEASTATATTEAVAEGPSLGTLLASADVSKGVKVFKKCGACHTVDDGGKNKIGPNLFAIIERPKGSASGFSYSDALVAKGGNWSYDDLDSFLAKPKDFIKGTKMSFAGLKKPTDRANLIAYLRTLGSDGVPLPAAN